MKAQKKGGPPRSWFGRSVAISLAVVVLLGWLLTRDATGPAIQASQVSLPLGGYWGTSFAILAAMVLSALYGAAETALDLLRPMHIKHVRDRDARRAERLQWLLEHREGLVASTIVGKQAMKLSVVLLGLLVAQRIAETRFGPHAAFEEILLIGLILSLPLGLLSLTFDLIPRSFAALHPSREALRMQRIVVGSWMVFGPFASLVTWLANLVTARFGGRASFEAQNLAEEEIKTLVEEAEESGEIEVDERELLHSVFEFTDTVVREVMTPRVDLDSLSVDSDPKDVIALIEQTGHSRIPLFENTDDQIVGIIHAKDLLMAASTGETIALRKLMRPALFVPENKSLHDLLREMRSSRTQMAIVQDEFGGTAGIATIEDIVEELVGDIVDEYDVEEPGIVEDDGAFYLGGKTHVDDVNEVLGSKFETDMFDTIGGFVFGLFGTQPKQGDCIASDGWRFCITDTDGRRILKLRVEPAGEANTSESADSTD